MTAAAIAYTNANGLRFCRYNNQAAILSSMQPTKRPVSKPARLVRHSYHGPMWLALTGTFLPLAISFAIALFSRRPQCPDTVTQAQIDTGSCIIGADMSLLWVFFALPLVLACIVTATIWAAIISWRNRQLKQPAYRQAGLF
jgi:hypothetical protein